MPWARRGGTDMRTIFAALLCALPLLATSPALADDLDVDLSKPDVRLDVSFEGADLLLFGAKDLVGDVIVVVRGPEKPTSIRFKERIAGVWVNTDEVVFDNAPAFYAVAASGPLKDLLPEATLAELQLGTDRLALNASETPAGASHETVGDFRAGLVRNMQRKNLYTTEPGEIRLVGKQLFRTDLWFPANVTVGDYVIQTYLVRDQVVASSRTTHLQVHKVGIEAQVYDFAHEHALIYGLLAIVVAVVSGWAANAVFKKRA